MGFSAANLTKVKEMYRTKYLIAREAAEERTEAVNRKYPDIAEINRELKKTFPEILLISSEGPENGEKMLALQKKTEELTKRLKQQLKSHGLPEDYLDVHYSCPLCADTGNVGIRMRSCMKRALIEEGYRSTGLGELLKTQTFDTFSLDYYKEKQSDYELMKDNLEFIRDYADHFEEGKSGSMLFMGMTGLGKTHLCSAVARQLVDQGKDVLYVSAVGMIADFQKQRFGADVPEAEIGSTERYYEADLLIIDDLGTEVVNQFTISVLYQVINQRLMTGRSMIINTNLDILELKEKYNDRITSRILGDFDIISFKGKDVRWLKTK